MVTTYSVRACISDGGEGVDVVVVTTVSHCCYVLLCTVYCVPLCTVYCVVFLSLVEVNQAILADRLVELSVCKKARLDSDTTLVAVITAVRKISLSRNISQLLENLGATELLNPCLVNSFKLFSTKHESFV